MVLEVDPTKRRISLGLKQCMENPWKQFAAEYKAGMELEGEIRNITEFGMFVGLPCDIDGMVHLSDVTWDDNAAEALKAYKKGDMVKVKILEVDPEKERVALGIKQFTENPFAGAADGMQKGTVVTCTITEVTDRGLEVKVNDTLTGFIKKSDLSRERSEQRPDRFAVGEKIDAKVVSFEKKGKVGLSIKAREIDEDKAALEAFGSSDSGASLGDILGAALSKDKGAATDSDEKPKKKASAKKSKKTDEAEGESSDSEE